MMRDVEKFVKFCGSDFGKRVLEREVEYVYRELRDCQKILDIGCGIGQFEQRLSELNIVGLDSSGEMLEEARKRSDGVFVIGDAENLEFSNALFDAVFYVTTLEFVSDYKKAIQEAWRVTKSNGKLLVMTLNSDSEYFHEHMQRKDSYFKRVRHTNIREVRNHIARFYYVMKEEYFLWIRGKEIFDTSDKKYVSLYVIVGGRKQKIISVRETFK